ncbi:MAG: SH3 domain-containing protein, partial [Chloroflexi bacterium]
ATPTQNAINPTAVALLSASIFTEPDANATEITFVDAGDSVTVLGRSPIGRWFYVQDDRGNEGYTYAPRYEWSGDFEALPIVPVPTAVPATTPTCEPGHCPQLFLDLYPLPGSRCENNVIYRTIYMRGQGGDGIYTYYWNDVKMAGPLENEGFGFEVNNLSGPHVIGRGKVVSGDGQVVEKELFVSDFTCNNQ